ncbi:hypothetical protein QCD71_16315 [Sphingomonas sp. PsM26]|nr:hypothetical protein [Sphingomonas sp. PsM26]
MEIIAEEALINQGNQLTLNQRVLGSSPSASTTPYIEIVRFLVEARERSGTLSDTHISFWLRQETRSRRYSCVVRQRSDAPIRRSPSSDSERLVTADRAHFAFAHVANAAMPEAGDRHIFGQADDVEDGAMDVWQESASTPKRAKDFP